MDQTATSQVMRVMNRCVRVCTCAVVQRKVAAPLVSTSAPARDLLQPPHHAEALRHGCEAERRSDLRETPSVECLSRSQKNEVRLVKCRSPCDTSGGRDTTTDIHPQKSPCSWQCRTDQIRD